MGCVLDGGGEEILHAGFGRSVHDAAGTKRSADWKLAVSLKLKREASVTNRWLAERLAMGTPKGVSAFCGLYPKEREGGLPLLCEAE